MMSVRDQRSGLGRPLLLTGMPGSGKSSTVRWLQHLTSLRAADMDDLFAKANGKSPAESIQSEGEEAFRLRESFLTTTLLAPQPFAPLIACGGGTLAQQELLNWAKERATVVFLHCDLDELERRLEGEGQRPLLEGAPLSEALKRLWVKREPFYRQADYTLNVTRLRPPEIAWRLAQQFGIAPSVSTGFQAHPEHLGWFEAGESLSFIKMSTQSPEGDLGRFVEELAPAAHKVLVVDKGLPEACLQELKRSLPGTPLVWAGPGEAAKQLERLPEYLEQFRQLGVHRNSVVLIAGGGAVLDAVGFACSVYMRGVSTVLIPTTLLGAIDASIGGKTAMDAGRAKNLCGSFFAPLAVYCPIPWLQSTDKQARRSFAGELLKVAILAGDTRLATWASKVAPEEGNVSLDVLAKAVASKLHFVTSDLHDRFGHRACLNLGHTFGHALESALGYRLAHGECVGAGLVVAARLSRHLGVADKKECAAWERLAVAAGLWPVADLPSVQELVRAMFCDKKQEVDSINWVLLRDWGVPVQRRLPRVEMENLLSAVL